MFVSSDCFLIILTKILFSLSFLFTGGHAVLLRGHDTCTVLGFYRAYSEICISPRGLPDFVKEVTVNILTTVGPAAATTTEELLSTSSSPKLNSYDSFPDVAALRRFILRLRIFVESLLLNAEYDENRDKPDEDFLKALLLWTSEYHQNNTRKKTDPRHQQQYTVDGQDTSLGHLSYRDPEVQRIVKHDIHGPKAMTAAEMDVLSSYREEEVRPEDDGVEYLEESLNAVRLNNEETILENIQDPRTLETDLDSVRREELLRAAANIFFRRPVKQSTRSRRRKRTVTEAHNILHALNIRCCRPGCAEHELRATCSG